MRFEKYVIMRKDTGEYFRGTYWWSKTLDHARLYSEHEDPEMIAKKMQHEHQKFGLNRTYMVARVALEEVESMVSPSVLNP